MPLKVFQFLAVVLMGVQLGVSYAHFMQMPGKLTLPLDCYILVQNQVISYRVKLAFIELPDLIATALAVLFSYRKRKTFWLTLTGLVCMVLMWLVWALFIQPINHQIDGWTPTRGLSSIGTENHAKAETATEKAFQKAIFRLTETYQLTLRVFGTES
ncbi:MAG: hypothetical protein ACAF41_20345 [Leptolyngbya sp. BL-A-14]